MQLNCTPTDLHSCGIKDIHSNKEYINDYITYMSDNYFKFNTFNVEEEMNMKINKLRKHLNGVKELIILNIMDTLFTMPDKKGGAGGEEKVIRDMGGCGYN